MLRKFGGITKYYSIWFAYPQRAAKNWSVKFVLRETTTKLNKIKLKLNKYENSYFCILILFAYRNGDGKCLLFWQLVVTYRFRSSSRDQLLQSAHWQRLLNDKHTLRQIRWHILVGNVLQKAVTITESFGR